jgi:hypothetical protein
MLRNSGGLPIRVAGNTAKVRTENTLPRVVNPNLSVVYLAFGDDQLPNFYIVGTLPETPNHRFCIWVEGREYRFTNRQQVNIRVTKPTVIATVAYYNDVGVGPAITLRLTYVVPTGNPVAVGTLDDIYLSSHIQSRSRGVGYGFSGGGTYSLVNAPEGVTINPTTGVITVNVTTTGRMDLTPFTVRKTLDAAFADQSINLLVGPPIWMSIPSSQLKALNDATLAKWMSLTVELGCEGVRIDLDWNNIETTPGNYDWSDYDRIFYAAKAANLKVMWIVKGTPSWARVQSGDSELITADTVFTSAIIISSEGVAVGEVTGGTNTPPTDKTTYGSFCTAASNHYAGARQVDHWEIWNEPNLVDFLDAPGANFKLHYPDLVHHGYTGLKASRSTNIVIFGALSSVPTPGDGNSYPMISAVTDVIADRTDNHAATKAWDGFSAHTYTTPFSPLITDNWSAFNILDDSIEIIDAFTGDASTDIYITEFGAPTGGTEGSTSWVITEEQQTQQLIDALQRCTVTSIRDRVKLFAWYSLGDYNISWLPGDHTEEHFGVIRMPNGDGIEKDITSFLRNYGLPGGAPVNVAPTIAVADITGSSIVGQTLTCIVVANGSPSPTVTFQWRINGIDVSGATDSTFSTTGVAVGSNVSCYVTAANINGTTNAITGVVTLTPAVTFEVVGNPSLSSATMYVGSTLTVDDATYTGGEPSTIATTLEHSTNNTTWTNYGSMPTTVPAIADGKYLRVRQVIVAPNGSTSTHYSASIGTFSVAALGKPAALTANNILVGDSYLPVANNTTWWKSDFSLAGTYVSQLDDEDLHEMQWSCSSATLTDLNTESCINNDGVYTMVMDDVGSRFTSGTNLTSSNTKIDFSVVRAGDPYQAKFRARYRIRATPTAPWSEFSDASEFFSIPDYVFPVLVENPQHNQIILRYQNEFDSSADFPDRFVSKTVNNAKFGRVGSQGLQWMHSVKRGVSNPNVILAVQDMGATRLSSDGGLTWYAPLNAGLRGLNAWDCYVDPANADQMYATLSTTWDPVKTEDEGIWYSSNRGVSWTLAKNLPYAGATVNYFRCWHDCFARYPLTTGSLSDAKLSHIICFPLTTRAAPDHSELWVKAAGGMTWAKVGSNLSASTYGYPLTLAQHPSSANTMMLVTTKGIWKTTNGGSSWTAWMSATFTAASRPNGFVFDPDNANNAIISTCGTGKGLYVTYNAMGTTPTVSQVLSGWASGSPAVGAKDANGRRRVAVNGRQENTTKNVNLSIWDIPNKTFSTWTRPSVVKNIDTGAAAYPSNAAVYSNPSGYDGSNSGGSFCATLFHPTDFNEFVQYGYHYFWKSTDGGASIKAANAFQEGVNITEVKWGDTSAKWGLIHMFCADIGYTRMNNAGRVSDGGINITPAQQTAKGLNVRTAVTGDVVPDSAPVAARRGRLIISEGTNSQQFIWYKDAPLNIFNGSNTAFTDSGLGKDEYARLEVDPFSPNYVYTNYSRSNDYGTAGTWSTMDARFVACSQLTEQRIWGFTSSTAGAGKIRRSNNRGASWSDVKSNLFMDANWPQVWIDPSSDERVYCVTSQGGRYDLTLLKLNANSVTISSEVNIPLWGQFAAGEKPNIWQLRSVAVDPNEPRIIYAAMYSRGNKVLFRGVWNSAFTSIMWEDCTRNLPRLFMVGFVSVSPWTGEVFIPTVNGPFIMARPYYTPHATNAAWGTALYTSTHTVYGSIHAANAIPPDNGWQTYVAT